MMRGRLRGASEAVKTGWVNCLRPTIPDSVEPAWTIYKDSFSACGLTTLLTCVIYVVMSLTQTTLYLRGMPAHLVREAKAVAARRGLTLAGLLSEALEQSLSGDTPREAVGQGLAESRRWYDRHRERLRVRYRGQFVAVVGRAVVDHDRSFDALAGRVFARFGPRPVWMPRVDSAEARARVRSPRRVKP